MPKNAILRVLHWGPLITLGIILSVSLCTVSCLGQWHNHRDTFLNLARAVKRGGAKGLAEDEEGKPEPTSWSVASPYVLALFLLLSCATLYYYLRAMWGGPGAVPPNWAPAVVTDRMLLQYCSLCQAYKPPRVHHCRQCKRCIPKMDHHCPWINNCVGHSNHAHFALFLSCAVIGCSVATCVLTPSVYWALYRRWYLFYGTGNAPIVLLSLWGLLINMFVLGLAIGVVAAVGLLLYFQVRSIVRNRTAIEDWILEKADHRRSEDGLPPFLYPYDLGLKGNVKQVFNNLWCNAVGDGIVWTVRDGCNQYTLTVEQLEQKACKRARSVLCTVVRQYSGSWVPVTHGLCTAVRPPCTDEPRIPLTLGDAITVTRWKKYWLYGDCRNRSVKSQNGAQRTDASATGTAYRHRGWFPRHCVVPLLEHTYRERLQQEHDEEDLKLLQEHDRKMTRKYNAEVPKEKDVTSVENDDKIDNGLHRNDSKSTNTPNDPEASENITEEHYEGERQDVTFKHTLRQRRH